MIDNTDIFERDMLFCLHSEFSVPVAFIDRDTGAELPTVPCIFDSTYAVLDPETQVEHVTQEPRLTVAESDLPFEAGEGDALVVKGARFVVYKVENYGLGALTLYLHESESA